MKYEEVIEIIERVRNGEKAEDIIDLEQETVDEEVTPQQALEVVKEAMICRTCKKPLVNGDELFVCKECAEKSREQFYQTDMWKALKDKDENSWTWLLGLMWIAGVFGWKGNNDKNEITCDSCDENKNKDLS